MEYDAAKVFKSMDRQLKRLGKSRKEAAEAFDVTPSWLSLISCGRRKPGDKLLERIVAKTSEWASVKPINLGATCAGIDTKP